MRRSGKKQRQAAKPAGYCGAHSRYADCNAPVFTPANLIAHWIGGDGKWSEAAHWDIGVVPTNGADTYTVVVDVAGATPNITVDTAVTISGLTNAEALHFTAGTFNLSGSLNNSGTMDVQTGATLNLTGAFTAPTFGSLTANGGTVQVSATLDLAGRNPPPQRSLRSVASQRTDW